MKAEIDMRVLVIGDIGWQQLYHLGDEAMTEAAIQMLRQRGIDDITLIAGKPSVATAMYGLPAVPRIGFAGAWDRGRMERKLREITDSLPSHTVADGEPTNVVDAVASVDAVLIAGGGNLNSQHVNHLFERAALVRIARHFGRPVFVSSQTVGPMLREIDLPLVREIVDYATCFGAREAHTLKLLLGLGGTTDRVVHTMDDAMMLTPSDAEFARAAAVRTSDRYIVGSFTAHPGTSGLSAADYHKQIAKSLDEIAAKHDVDVLLVPHAGSLDRSVRNGDQLANDSIVAASTSGRLINLDMMTAGEAIALSARAEFSLSTRYHPTVFGPFAGKPSIAISLSYYSSVRMRGSLDNVGMQPYVVPTAAWLQGTLNEVVDDVLSHQGEFAAHMSTVAPLRLAEQNRWWDAIVSAMRGGEWTSPDGLSPVDELAPEGWSREVESITRVADTLGQLQIKTGWLEKANGDLRAERDKLAAEVVSGSRATAAAVETTTDLKSRVEGLEHELATERSRRAVRFANAVGRATGKSKK